MVPVQVENENLKIINAILFFSEPDEWVLESEVCSLKHVSIRSVAAKQSEGVNIALYPALNGGKPPLQRVKQRRKPVKTT